MGPYTDNYLRTFFHAQFCTDAKPAPPGTNLSGQVAIITGASGGLGLHAANHLLGLGLSHLVIAVRSPAKGEFGKVKLQAKFPHAKIEVWAGLEMTKYETVQDFVRRVDRELPRVDMVVLNAGVSAMKFKLAETGHEEIIQVNYLSTALLAILLLPVLGNKSRASPTATPTHLTFLGSALAYVADLPKNNGKFTLASLDNAKSFSTARYGLSKLLLTLFFVRLFPYISPERDGVIIDIIEPGYCKGTDLARDARGALKVLVKGFEGMVGRKAEDGAWMHVYAAAVVGSEAHGCYLQDWEVRS
ncbi:hypothetical protein C8F01DRAFT_991324 [Mycena amicta]|nr:hypothetical protein C8F01DRAFT_991324 [Mycena amicta]